MCTCFVHTCISILSIYISIYISVSRCLYKHAYLYYTARSRLLHRRSDLRRAGKTPTCVHALYILVYLYNISRYISISRCLYKHTYIYYTARSRLLIRRSDLRRAGKTSIYVYAVYILVYLYYQYIYPYIRI